MPLTLVDLPLELLGFILELIPVYQVEKYALTCKLLFAISSKLIKKHALQRAMYTSICSDDLSSKSRMKPILDTLMEPELSVYVRNLSVSLSCWPPYNADERATTQACDILEQVSQTLPKAMVKELWRDARNWNADVVAALALVRLVNLTTLKVSDEVSEVHHTIDMIGYAAFSQRSGGDILQHLSEIKIEMQNGSETRDFDDSYGLIMSLPSLRKLLLSNIWLEPDTTWSQQCVAPLSYLGLFDCTVAPGILRMILHRLQHLKAFVFDCDNEPDFDDDVVSMWDILDIIKKSGLQSSLVSLTLKHTGWISPHCTHIESLHDFDYLEVLETNLGDSEADESTCPPFHVSDRPGKFSAPYFKQLRLKYRVNTIDQGMEDFALIRLLVDEFLQQMPTLHHLDIDFQHALQYDHRCELVRICEESGVLLSM